MRSAGCNAIARPVFGMTEIIPIAATLSSYLWDTTLDILRASGGCRELSGCRLCLTEGVLAGCLLCAFLDLERTFKPRSTLDKNLPRSQVSGHRRLVPDFDPAFCAHVSLHVSPYQHVSRGDTGAKSCRWSNGQLSLAEADDTFDGAINKKILGAGDFSLH